MKTTKRFLMLLLAVCLCVGLMTVTASAADTASGSCGENLSWKLSADGTLTISGSGAMTDYSWLDAPWLEYSDSIRTVVVQSGVTTLCDNAFYDCDRLTSVSLPNTLTTIGYRAFGNCNALGRIQLPDSVTSLGRYAFSDCSALTSVILPDGISQIPSGTFASSGLTSIAIPDSVTVIGSYAFNYCPSLTSVSLPSGLELIEECAFAGCNAITSITVPAGAKLESGALPRCVVTIAAAHPDYSTDSKGVLFNKDKTVLIQAPLSLSGSYTIPGTVQRIEPDAFTGCANLTGVTIPDSVTEIGYGAFCYSGLKSVTIPASVTTMGGELFYNCDSLTTATVLAKADTLPDSMFENCDNLTTVTLPEGLVDMGGYTFFYCTKLKSVNIPSTVTTLGYGVFNGCTSLESVTIPAGVTEIYDDTFRRCSSLKAITVATGNPNYCSDSKGVLYNKGKTVLMQAPGKLSGAYTVPATVTTINGGAFSNCTGLTKVTLPEGIDIIGTATFSGCTGLESVNIPSTVTEISYSAFYGCESLKSVTIPASVTSIHSSAFSNTGLTAVTIPAGVTELAGSSFGQCPNLTKITVAAGNPNYSNDSNGALYNKDKTVLYTVPGGFSGSFTIPNTVTELSWSAFYGCSKVTAVTIPGTLETVSGFWGCTGLKTVTIKSGVKTIDYAAFQGCSSLESVSIPASVTSIADNSFDKCPKLTTLKVASGNKNYCTDENGILFTKDMTEILFVPMSLSGDYTIPGTVTNINEAFSGSQITSLTVPGSVTEMSGWVFKDCTKLKSVTIGSGVTELAYGAFRGCTSLTNVDLPDTLTTIPWDTFTNCTGLKTITIPEGVTTIESYAFDQCKNLKNVVFAGDAPVFDSSYGDPPFVGVKATAWYPYGNSTWTKEVRQDYGGTITWKSYKPLGIKTQPTTQKVKAGSTAKFTVSVSGPAPTYQWQYRTSSSGTWKNCTATGNKTATLKVPATTAKSGYQYRCVITDALGNKVTTKTVYLYVLGIKTQPTAKNVKAGVTAKLTVSATGHNKTYQWQYKNSAGKWVNATATGNKTATLKVKATTALNGRQYRCVIKDSAGNQVITNTVKLTVFGIKTQPTAKTVKAGNTAKFSVTATGSGLSYQWQYRTSSSGAWKNIGSGKSALSVTATAKKNGYQYRCIVTDSAGNQVITNVVKLTVK